MSPGRFRFAPVKCAPSLPGVVPFPDSEGEDYGRHQRKSRSGCQECKARRVKCDETFPVCLRCQRRGSICLSKARSEQWQVETPWISGNTRTSNPGLGPELGIVIQGSIVNKKLLRHWFEQTSRIMVLDHGANPLSLPITQYLPMSASLVHILQSISAAHEHFFSQQKLALSLEERSRALTCLRQELQSATTISLLSCMLTGYLLGISSTFIDEHVFDYGKEHLFALGRMIEMILTNPEARQSDMTQFVVGAYVYWNMTCSLLIDPDEQQPPCNSLEDYLMRMRQSRHPINGLYTELFHLLGSLGRYCRSVLQYGVRDFEREQVFETRLTTWKIPPEDELDWIVTANAFRNHGLLVLYRTCPPGRHAEDTLNGEDNGSPAHKQYLNLARDTSRQLLGIPVSSHFLSLQAMPLFTMAAELTKEDHELREQVVSRFKALFSFNRLPSNLYAIQLLRELWGLVDMGVHITWLELMLSKNWRLRLG